MREKSMKQMMVCLFVFSTVMAGCSIPKVASHWRTDEINANGIDDDWRSTPQYYDEDNHVAVKILNDEETLYVCFSANDGAMQKKLIMAGFTVWLDPQGGKEKKYGIRLSMKPARPPSEFSEEDRERIREGGPLPFGMPKTLEVIHPDLTDPLKMKIAEAAKSGVEVGIGQPNGRLVCEYKIKTKGESSILAFATGESLGMGIESGAPDFDGMKRKGRPGGGPMGGPGGGMGRPDGGMGGPGGMGRPGGGGPFGGGGMMGKPPGGMKGHRGDFMRMKEPFEIWLKVKMARKFDS